MNNKTQSEDDEEKIRLKVNIIELSSETNTETLMLHQCFPTIFKES